MDALLDNWPLLLALLLCLGMHFFGHHHGRDREEESRGKDSGEHHHAS